MKFWLIVEDGDVRWAIPPGEGLPPAWEGCFDDGALTRVLLLLWARKHAGTTDALAGISAPQKKTRACCEAWAKAHPRWDR